MSGSGIGGGGSGGGGSVAGDWVVIDVQTVSSSTASVTFTSAIDSTYDHYMLEWLDVTGDTDNDTFALRLSTNNGSSWLSTNEYGIALGGNSMSSSAWTGHLASVARGQIDLSTATHDSGAANVAFGHSVINNPESSSTRTTCAGECTTNDSTGRSARHYHIGSRWTAEAHDALQLLFLSGNITNGTFILKGLKK